jgi:NADPH:quinone reductase-like Zn-dependent oxidoreductase
MPPDKRRAEVKPIKPLSFRSSASERLTGWRSPKRLSRRRAAPLALLVACKVLERAGGPVGAATVSLAAARGLSVHGVGSGADEDYVRSLRARGLTDYRSASARALSQRFDIVLDDFGGNSLADSCAVVKSGGRIVSLKAMTDTDDMEAQGMKVPWFLKLLMPLAFREPRKLAESSGARLIGLAPFPDGESLARAADEALAVGYRPRNDSEVALDDALAAFTRLQSTPRGKVVVRLPGADLG